MLHLISEAQKLGKPCAFIDAEHAFDPTYAESIGVNLETLYFNQPSCGEEGLEIVDTLIATKQFGVIVVDSVAALVPKAELDGEMGESKMGLHARLMSQALRKLVGKISQSSTIVVFINQLRDKIGITFGNPETTTGGNALKFYASVRIDIRKSGSNKVGEEITGNKIKVKVIKNKVAPPFRNCNFDILFGVGIDSTGEAVDTGTELGIITKAGSWYSYGDTKIGQGRDGVVTLLNDNPELYEEIVKKIKKECGLQD